MDPDTERVDPEIERPLADRLIEDEPAGGSVSNSSLSGSPSWVLVGRIVSLCLDFGGGLDCDREGGLATVVSSSVKKAHGCRILLLRFLCSSLHK